MHISSSYAKILGVKLFCTLEITSSGLKAEDGGKRGEKERNAEKPHNGENNGENNGQAMHGARKPPGPIPNQLQSSYFGLGGLSAPPIVKSS